MGNDFNVLRMGVATGVASGLDQGARDRRWGGGGRDGGWSPVGPLD